MCSSVNEARYEVFKSKYAPSSIQSPLAKIKGADASMMPPCQQVLLQKVKRSNYVAFMWKHAHTAEPVLEHPEDHGWTLQNGQYRVKWYDGEQMPGDISNSVIQDVLTDNDSDSELYAASSDEDSDLE